MKNNIFSPPKPPWRPRKIETPQCLRERFVEYAKHVESNPLVERKLLKTSNGTVGAELRKDRPMTIAGFCSFIGVTSQAWRYWRTNREDLKDPIELIENAIYAYKFERAATGIFKANIISRELGLMRKR
ncbi:terminase small subunit [Leisingera sp. ANG59]|uniref:terminase small subunit n=1 Tax=Leisingera sp. ANG59 TaxID=2675221 RepID=UPI0015732805|nr:terminase small subunit [Leisingera sp. ANG59]